MKHRSKIVIRSQKKALSRYAQFLIDVRHKTRLINSWPAPRKSA